MIPAREAANLLSRLEAVADKLGVTVRYEMLVEDGEAGSRRGGLCRLRGDSLILVDRSLGPVERCLSLAEALGGFDLSRIYLPPVVRRIIEEQRSED